MLTVVDDRLRSEVRRYRLQFACPHCAYYDEFARRCSEGYPTDEHERTDLERGQLLFCKLFEAG